MDKRLIVLARNKNMSNDVKIKEEVNHFLRRNFPQIQMHGGEAQVVKIDSESKTVEIELTGACDGCGLSPMTTQVIKRRMADEIDGIENVIVHTGMGGSLTDNDGDVTPTERTEPDVDYPF